MDSVKENIAPPDSSAIASAESSLHAKSVGKVDVTDADSRDNKPRSTLWRRILSFIWDSIDGDPEYRRYIQRLDLFFL